MTTVYWNTVAKDFGVDGHKGDLDSITMAYFELQPVFTHVVGSRDASADGHYTKCPAFIEYFKNTYVVRSPVDLKLYYDTVSDRLSITPQGQEFYDKFVHHRGIAAGKAGPFLMSLAFYHLFIADKECHIELLPATFHGGSFTEKARLIPGTFDISKWYRPVEVAFEFLNPSAPIDIKRGDPLCYVRFIPKDTKKIRLVKHEFSEEVARSCDQCIGLKSALPKQPLSSLYEIAKKHLAPVKKCPFSWSKKWFTK